MFYKLSKISSWSREREKLLAHSCMERRWSNSTMRNISPSFSDERKRRSVYMCIYICVCVYTNEIFILAGADAHREPRMGGTVRATDVQRWRGHVSYDPAQKATRWKLLEACSRNYQRFFEYAEENRPHFRPLCRHGDSFLGPEEIVSVSTRNSPPLLLTFSPFFFFYIFIEIGRFLEKINFFILEIRVW